MNKTNSSDTRAKVSGKPERPEGSPLFWHKSGRWCKKIRGKFHYFGRESHAEALKEYERDKDDLHAGRRPQQAGDGLTMFQLAAKFLEAKKTKRDNGELANRTFVEYGELCNRMVRVFGKSRLASDLRPDDFAKLRGDMAKRWGPIRLRSQIVLSRTVFNWAFKQRLIDQPPHYGDAFNVPTEKTIRVHRAKQGAKMFEADEIKRMLEAAKQPLKAMILLAANCAFGNHDIALLPIDALDLERGWINFARPKTGVGRRCPLWPETIEAVKEWLAIRPEPFDPQHANLLFITYKRGSWLNTCTSKGGNRSLSHEFRKLLDGLGIDGHRGFYAIRHTFQTIGDESGDFLAVRALMGHVSRGDVADHYRERMKDERLQKVTNTIHDWLWQKEQPPTKDAKPEPESQATILKFPSAAG